jgi:putative YphP/YqiW family bacilliredoxin
MYPAEIVMPMKEELTDVGFENLDSAEKVAELLSRKGSALIIVNSVCGCAAANARPAAITSLEGTDKPDHIGTVFAGFDTEATAKAREFMVPFPPSSPSIALFHDGEVVHMLERHHIEGRPAQMIADNLKDAYSEVKKM